MEAAKRLHKSRTTVLKSSLKKLEIELRREEVNLITLKSHSEKTENQLKVVEEAFNNRVDVGEEEEAVLEQITNDFWDLAASCRDAITRAQAIIPIQTVETQERSSSETDGRQEARLPTIHIEPFDGDYTKWMTFVDVFNALVHNKKNLMGAEKLQLLKNCLKGEAAETIAYIPVTNDSYEEAWELLQSHYNSRRLIVDKLFSQLLGIKAIDSSSGLKHLFNTVSGIYRNIRTLKLPDTWEVFLCHFVKTRFDKNTASGWEERQSDEVPDFTSLMKYIEGKLKTSIATNGHTEQPPQINKPFKNQLSCPACKQHHKAWGCDAFRQASVNERWNLIKAARLCVNCLQGTHAASACWLSGCKHCKEKHHSLLHNERRYVNYKEKISNDENKPGSSKTVATSIKAGENALLGTAYVYVMDGNGNLIKVRALLDQGAQTNLFTSDCLKRLKLPQRAANTSVQCVGSAKPQAITKEIDIVIKNKSGDFCYKGSALVMDHIMEEQPQQFIKKPMKFIEGLNLADEDFNKPGPIEALLGVEFYMQACRRGLRHPKGNGPGAQNTALGWVLMGSLTPDMVSIHQRGKSCFVNVLTTQANSLWALQEVPNAPVRTDEDKICENSYQVNTFRQPDGSYTVRLPLCKTPPDLGESRGQAIKRFLNLERKFKTQNREFEINYKNAIEDLKMRGHMVEAPPVTTVSYYIPHHAVTKMSSLTTKTRVVFDASAKSSNGKSLNDNMFTGPRLQDDLVNILTRFRTHRFVVTADIEKMYRMIWLHQDDQPLHRIIWRDSESAPLQEYVLTTVSFGVKSAPFLAIRTLLQLAKDEGHQFPMAAKALVKDFYVDDVLSGAETEEEAATLVEQLINLLNSGGFHLTKWASNSSFALKKVKSEDQTIAPLHIMDEAGIKTLGLQWIPEYDKFRFSYEIPKHSSVTKRTMLSDIGKLFDPLGWLAPLTIRGRITFQNLWRQQLDWDTVVPHSFAKEWNEYNRDLQGVNNVTIERCIKGRPGRYSLYGFSDASEAAYGACVYLRTESNGEVQAHLIAAKSRVASLHATSIPRLELCGALELANLLESLEGALGLNIEEVHAFTDSTITMQWITNHNVRWKPFVANRVSAIHNAVPHAKWHHIAGKDNIADYISRGIKAQDLVGLQEWWTGPSVIYQPSQKEVDVFLPEEEARREARATSICNVVVPTRQANIINRFSDLNRLLRVTSWIKRFLIKTRRGETNNQPYITPDELQASIKIYIKLAQREAYPTLVNKGIIPNNLQTLSPFLDGEGIIRVGGRLKNAEVSVDQRQPILLPREAWITRLLVEHTHKETLHGGPQLIITTLRQNYWIPRIKNLVKQVNRQCGRCVRLRAQTCTQLMGDLPRSRVTAARPFQRTGVDYMGPFWLKTRTGRGAKRYKGYVAIFICFTTRAIHLEYVGDLTTASFLGSLRRFIARRGKPSEIFSDSGTNLVGGNNELKNYLKIVNSDSRQSYIGHELSDLGIKWHFNPPSAPHFGGLWEAGVKSTKYHLKRIVGDKALTTEELETVLCQVEAVLNSRPLVDISEDPSDFQVLTPGHFLIGGPLITHPEPNFTEFKESHLTRWTRIQQMVQHFWRRWHREYLTRLQQRPKWAKITKSLEKEELVLLKEDNVPPLQWHLARVTELHPGTDGHVRVVTVKTAKGLYKRPVTKICRLPISRDKESEDV